MNVVGKVGSLISQGVYSVATPFHPFGGAVDVIVVQQQDGTFRSTPWFVRFGKFQGVLKGAEKIVGINVNGAEANFHMFLDNSGEAYFIKEVVSVKSGAKEANVKESESLEVVDKGRNLNEGDGDSYLGDVGTSGDVKGATDVKDVEFQDNGPSLRMDEIEQVDSEERRFYEFQDVQSVRDESSLEYGHHRFHSFDSVDQFVESQDSTAEVILVSVDGHVLTAPILTEEKNTENLQLSTPQFHLGPGEATDFVEGNEEFSAGENGWAAGYICDLDTTPPKDFSKDDPFLNAEINGFEHQLAISKGETGIVTQVQEVCEILSPKSDLHVNGVQEVLKDANRESNLHVDSVQENLEIARQESDVSVDINSEDAYTGVRAKEIYKSCLELPELANNHDMADVHGSDSPLEVHGDAEDTQDKLPHTLVAADEIECGIDYRSHANDSVSLSSDNSGANLAPMSRSLEVEPLEKPVSETENLCSDIISIHSVVEDSGLKFEQFDKVPADDISVDSVVNDSGSKDEQFDDMPANNISIHSVINDSELQDEQFDEVLEGERFESSPSGPSSETESSKSKMLEPQAAFSSEGIQTDSSLEISLCGIELRPGMGLAAAAEAFDSHRISEEEFKLSAASILKNENLIIRIRDQYLTWDKAAPFVLGMAAFGLSLPVVPNNAIPVEKLETPKLRDDDSDITSTPSGRRWKLWPIPFRRVKTLEQTSSNSSNEEVFVDSESGSQQPHGERTPTTQSVAESPHKQLFRTNIPTSEQIASLNLKEGQNVITFSFSSRVLGRQQVDAHIFLWKWNDKIVISDVDGTITKSDVLGQFMPLVGKDWTQSGVARLFSAIKENGYQLLFLSARAIVQAYLTRSFLLNLKQDGKTLPNGPVVISPDGLFPSLYREVIRRAPHEFKIACLEDIKSLFPPDYNPFYAGFGNRDTDELSYRKIGIPKGKIFIINPKGEVAISHRIDVKSYTSLHTLVNDMFPPTSLVEQARGLQQLEFLENAIAGC
ncbi:Lipin, middle domain [Dillenia turbinata]|uniref:phosphatidate phosphatase n=1 Tax=Dillenia turbinata TaxID=194707 RepID=A0AAN8W7N6_9MAGN